MINERTGGRGNEWIEGRLWKEAMMGRRMSKEKWANRIGIKISRNYNSKKEDLEEEDQRQDERNVIL